METVACLLEFKQRMMLKVPLYPPTTPLYMLCMCPITLYYKESLPPNLKIIADVRHEA